MLGVTVKMPSNPKAVLSFHSVSHIRNTLYLWPISKIVILEVVMQLLTLMSRSLGQILYHVTVQFVVCLQLNTGLNSSARRRDKIYLNLRRVRPALSNVHSMLQLTMYNVLEMQWLNTERF
jgi:hypothetical protein